MRVDKVELTRGVDSGAGDVIEAGGETLDARTLVREVGDRLGRGYRLIVGKIEPGKLAITYLGMIKSRYPKSNVAKQSSELDSTLKKSLKDKSKCQS